MNEHDKQIRDAHVPPAIQTAVANGQLHKIAEHRLRVEILSLEKIAQYIGQKFAERQQRWRPVAEGLIALRQLRGK